MQYRFFIDALGAPNEGYDIAIFHFLAAKKEYVSDYFIVLSRHSCKLQHFFNRQCNLFDMQVAW